MSQFHYPAWLNQNYFENLLRKKFKNTSIKVNRVKVEPCGAANDGFLSMLFRVHVHFLLNSKEENDSFVVKISSTQEIAIEKVGSNGYDVQNKEMLFFEVVAPRIEKILKSIGEESNVIPKAVFIDREHDAIVFEDLKKLNFVMADRMVGLDENHVK
jgi:hypothetical protein